MLPRLQHQLLDVRQPRMRYQSGHAEVPLPNRPRGRDIQETASLRKAYPCRILGELGCYPPIASQSTVDKCSVHLANEVDANGHLFVAKPLPVFVAVAEPAARPRTNKREYACQGGDR